MTKTWESYGGEEILYNAMDGNGNISGESMFEDAVKLGIDTSSRGECQLLKFYWTDGFGWYFDRDTKKITFVLHECKVGDSVTGKTMRGYKTCLRKTFLQNIGYYYKIKNREYITFSLKLKKIAEEFWYNDVNQFVIDHFGMFLITTPKFVCNITLTDDIISLLNDLDEPIKNTTKSPSQYWQDWNLRRVMENFDVDDIPFVMMPEKVDLADTGEILNNILK